MIIEPKSKLPVCFTRLRGASAVLRFSALSQRICLKRAIHKPFFDRPQASQVGLKWVLPTAFVGTSLCLASTSGKVVDSAGIGIAGAIVKLEKGGQSDTTGSDGSFTLSSSAIRINTSLDRTCKNNLSASIHNGLLHMKVSEKSAVEISTFDFSGKALLTKRESIDAGSHYIPMPQRSNGIYLYEVKAGNIELVLKGVVAGGISFGRPQFSQRPTSPPPSMQARRISASNDVIAAAKTGYLNYRAVVKNPDTSGLEIRMIAIAGMVKDADGNEYQAVRIGKQEWTVENLRVTKYNDNTPIALDTAWPYDTNAVFCYYGNKLKAEVMKNQGVLYKWYVVKTGKLSPAGWHVPSDAEWDTLQNYLIANGFNWDGSVTENKTARSLAAKTDWSCAAGLGDPSYNLALNNTTGFSALPSGARSYGGLFGNLGTIGDWWSATQSDVSTAFGRRIDCGNERFFRTNLDKSSGFAIRLVRD